MQSFVFLFTFYFSHRFPVFSLLLFFSLTHCLTGESKVMSSGRKMAANCLLACLRTRKSGQITDRSTFSIFFFPQQDQLVKIFLSWTFTFGSPVISFFYFLSKFLSILSLTHCRNRFLVMNVFLYAFSFSRLIFWMIKKKLSVAFS